MLDVSSGELIKLLDRADALADAWRQNRMPKSLANRQVALWFYGSGFRNRLAFETGARAMGAEVSYVPGDLGIHEPIEDIGGYLERWFSLLVVRAQHHADLVKLTDTTGAAVINARTDSGHPCEVMGDLQFIRRHRGSLDDLKVVFAGEVTNLCMSWFEAAVRLPITVIQVAPEGYGAGKQLLDWLNALAVGKIETRIDFGDSLEGADLLYTDCWPKAEGNEERERVAGLFLPHQITREHLSQLSDDALFLPCPPVTRGQEVSQEAMLSPLCRNHDAKECLLFSQCAIMEAVLRGSDT